MNTKSDDETTTETNAIERAEDMIEEASDLLTEARDELEKGSNEWQYVMGAAAQSESALALIDGLAVLEDDSDEWVEDDNGNEVPRRSEPADFGGGESTGVQKL